MDTACPLSREECQKIVEVHFQTDTAKIRKFSLTSRSNDIQGFMGDHLQLRVSVSVKGKDEKDSTEDVEFFVKSVPMEEGYRRTFATSGVAYKKEVLFYGDLLRSFQKHLRCAAYESSTLLRTVPQCYYLRPDVLVLEDLAPAGFRMLDPSDPLDVDHCECVLKALARLHAASLIFEEREGRRLADAYPLLLEESLFLKQPELPFYQCQRGCVDGMHAAVDLVARYAPGTPLNRDLHRLLSSTMDTIYELVQPTDKYRNVVCHKDLWPNNMLFAEDAQRGLSVRLVDFQTAKLAPPAYDVLSFLHLSSMRDLRQAHGRRLLELYHQTLADVLRQHDLDVDSVLPLQDFLQSCEDTRPLAVIVAAYVLLIVMIPLQDGDMHRFMTDRPSMVKEAFQRDERFRQRISQALDDLVEVCILPRIQDQQR
ncbi:uncharacterized protein LOC124596152 [Schistocerca americana]|uniref:uncharacterized protein LOC124596152 n=1 Tax=Schistocerca americana TaxID=7009 RepID=UPI001F50052A|nr:uncharacterized protein LOC124596152 [Schistocerca americana]